MDNEKINELAERYADKECAMSSHKGRKLLQLHEDKIIEFYDVLGFLSETHCLVEKEKVVDLISKNREYKEYDSLMNNFPEDLIPERTDWHTLQGYADGLYYLIEDINTILL